MIKDIQSLFNLDIILRAVLLVNVHYEELE